MNTRNAHWTEFGQVSEAGPPPAATRLWHQMSGAVLLRCASFLSIVAAWILLSHIIGARILPGPVETLQFAGQQLVSGNLIYHVGATLQRILLALAGAMVLGTAVGLATGAVRWLDQLLVGWLAVGLTIPRIVLFVVAYLVLGLNELAIVVSLILTIGPHIVVHIREGTHALDTRLSEMARAYRRPRLAVWRHVLLPQLLPYVIGALRSSLSMAWRLVVLGELLGRTSGVGYQIHYYFQTFHMTGILAYGLAMMAALLAVDVMVTGVIQRFALRWRYRTREAAP